MGTDTLTHLPNKLRCLSPDLGRPQISGGVAGGALIKVARESARGAFRTQGLRRVYEMGIR